MRKMGAPRSPRATRPRTHLLSLPVLLSPEVVLSLALAFSGGLDEPFEWLDEAEPEPDDFDRLSVQ